MYLQDHTFIPYDSVPNNLLDFHHRIPVLCGWCNKWSACICGRPWCKIASSARVVTAARPAQRYYMCISNCDGEMYSRFLPWKTEPSYNFFFIGLRCWLRRWPPPRIDGCIGPREPHPSWSPTASPGAPSSPTRCDAPCNTSLLGWGQVWEPAQENFSQEIQWIVYYTQRKLCDSVVFLFPSVLQLPCLTVWNLELLMKWNLFWSSGSRKTSCIWD